MLGEDRQFERFVLSNELRRRPSRTCRTNSGSHPRPYPASGSGRARQAPLPSPVSLRVPCVGCRTMVWLSRFASPRQARSSRFLLHRADWFCWPWLSSSTPRAVAGHVQADGDANVDVVVLDARRLPLAISRTCCSLMSVAGRSPPSPPPLAQEPEHGPDVAACQRLVHGDAVTETCSSTDSGSQAGAMTFFRAREVRLCGRRRWTGNLMDTVITLARIRKLLHLVG